jgi:hypothetical protein
MVKATVVRGTFTERGKDGDRIVKPDDENPVVDVTEAQLEAFKGVLVPSADADLERKKVRAETQRVTLEQVEAQEEAASDDSSAASKRRR